jgi:hypothetical protein
VNKWYESASTGCNANIDPDNVAGRYSLLLDAKEACIAQLLCTGVVEYHGSSGQKLEDRYLLCTDPEDAWRPGSSDVVRRLVRACAGERVKHSEKSSAAVMSQCKSFAVDHNNYVSNFKVGCQYASESFKTCFTKCKDFVESVCWAACTWSFMATVGAVDFELTDVSIPTWSALLSQCNGGICKALNGQEKAETKSGCSATCDLALTDTSLDNEALGGWDVVERTNHYKDVVFAGSDALTQVGFTAKSCAFQYGGWRNSEASGFDPSNVNKQYGCVLTAVWLAFAVLEPAKCPVASTPSVPLKTGGDNEYILLAPKSGTCEANGLMSVVERRCQVGGAAVLPQGTTVHRQLVTGGGLPSHPDALCKTMVVLVAIGHHTSTLIMSTPTEIMHQGIGTSVNSNTNGFLPVKTP